MNLVEQVQKSIPLLPVETLKTLERLIYSSLTHWMSPHVVDVKSNTVSPMLPESPWSWSDLAETYSIISRELASRRGRTPLVSSEFDKIVVTARQRQDHLLKVKGDDYTRHEPDRLSNFKRAAAGLGISPLQVWAVYASKHWDALLAFVKTGKAESEAIEGRFDDLANYLYLGEALIKEEEGQRG